MKKFELVAKITISVYTTVMAKSKEEAIEIAEQRDDMMSISCNNGETPETSWIADCLDGVPFDIEIE